MHTFRQSIILAILLCVALLSACAQGTTLAAVLQDGTLPLTLRLQDLNADWVQITLRGAQSANPSMHFLTSIFRYLNIPGDMFYTRGRTMRIEDQPYLVAYQRIVDPMQVRMLFESGDLPEPFPLAPDTPLVLALIPLRDFHLIAEVTPFDRDAALAPPAPRDAAQVSAARVAQLIASLHQLRNAIEQFQADTGLYPARLADLVRPQQVPPPVGIGDDGQVQPLPEDAYHGPYLHPHGGIAGAPGIPLNPLVDLEAGEPDPGNVATHWNYDAVTHLVTVPVAMADLRDGDGTRLGDL